ncbi:hypothetical protein K523DRAFT_63725 [Schizophyllum commune Tattone D]|nr:hypothetical protein K523DRAFT_63725 [Schizophyllum commune Tattone D]
MRRPASAQEIFSRYGMPQAVAAKPLNRHWTLSSNYRTLAQIRKDFRRYRRRALPALWLALAYPGSITARS